MPRMRVIAAALALTAASLSAAPPSLAQEISLAPEQLAEMFCLARLAGDMDAVSGLLSPDLTAAIAEAQAQNAALAGQFPDEKPPLGDGVPWSSFQDHPDTCEGGEPEWQMDEARLRVTYTFAGAPDAAVTDSLWLRLIERESRPKVWRIDNISYGMGDDLRTVLRIVFMD